MLLAVAPGPSGRSMTFGTSSIGGAPATAGDAPRQSRSAVLGYSDTLAADYAEDPRARAIAEAALRLIELRDRWLNPPEWLEWVEEPVRRFPKRTVARNEAAEKELGKRTLTNVYNARPQWLDDAHGALDAAVAATYEWSPGITEDDALRELLKMNRST